jgi:hypothetical protein
MNGTKYFVFPYHTHRTQNLFCLNLDLHLDLYWMTLYDASRLTAFAGKHIPWPTSLTPPEH